MNMHRMSFIGLNYNLLENKMPKFNKVLLSPCFLLSWGQFSNLFDSDRYQDLTRQMFNQALSLSNQ